MDIKTTISCPLGHKCREVKDGQIYECAWFIKLAGTNPTTGDVVDEFGCAMKWVPILLVENANTNRSTSAAIESFRNEMVTSNNISSNILLGAIQHTKP